MPRQVQSRSRDDAEQRRAQILTEAVELIGQRGCYGFTIQELAKRCGLSNAGLLHHFRSRDVLLVAVLQELERQETAAMTPLALAAHRQAGPAAGAASLELLKTIVARTAAKPQVMRLTSVVRAESLDPSHPAHAWSQAQEAVVLDLFTKLLAPYVDEPRSAARQLLALMNGLALQWLRAEGSFDIVAEWLRAIAAIAPALAADAALKQQS